ncbi:hypothetical protein [Thermococcus litoralis]|uniref:hypothetical protein n=1 Tax=Thermococcus litoralis TaxID=2265 RepID=UPI001C4FFF82|nr:hypothetical protein [Thermococcus litoralis]
MIPMPCTDRPWQYGIRSPNPSDKIYGGFIQVKTPPILPEDLNCLIVIWASLSTSSGHFYQTSLGFHPDWGWHISAGSTNPQLECDLACPPFKLNGQIFRPKPNTVYELGIRIIPQDSTNKVHLYFVDLSTNMLYDIYVLDDSGNVSTPIGGILEAYTVDPSELSKLGGNNAFRIVNANWLIEPWTSTRWPHGYVYEAKGNGYETTPEDIQIKLLSSGELYIGYKVGGEHYPSDYQLW